VIGAPGLAYADARGRVYFDETVSPLADDGTPRSPRARNSWKRAGHVTAMFAGASSVAGGSSRGEETHGVGRVITRRLYAVIDPAYVSTRSADVAAFRVIRSLAWSTTVYMSRDAHGS